LGAQSAALNFQHQCNTFALVAPSRSGRAAPGTIAPAAGQRPVNTWPLTETYTYDADGQRVTALCAEQSEEWVSGRRYLDIDAQCLGG
jgi:hypothetical protein